MHKPGRKKLGPINQLPWPNWRKLTKLWKTSFAKINWQNCWTLSSSRISSLPRFEVHDCRELKERNAMLRKLQQVTCWFNTSEKTYKNGWSSSFKKYISVFVFWEIHKVREFYCWAVDFVFYMLALCFWTNQLFIAIIRFRHFFYILVISYSPQVHLCQVPNPNAQPFPNPKGQGWAFLEVDQVFLGKTSPSHLSIVIVLPLVHWLANQPACPGFCLSSSPPSTGSPAIPVKASRSKKRQALICCTSVEVTPPWNRRHISKKQTSFRFLLFSPKYFAEIERKFCDKTA